MSVAKIMVAVVTLVKIYLDPTDVHAHRDTHCSHRMEPWDMSSHPGRLALDWETHTTLTTRVFVSVHYLHTLNIRIIMLSLTMTMTMFCNDKIPLFFSALIRIIVLS